MEELSQENEKLKENYAVSLEEMVEEANRRHQKRKKVIISNLPEPSSGSLQERKSEDRSAVCEIISDLGLDDVDFETQRIGKTDSKRPRLLCVTSSDKASKFELQRSAKELRKSEKYRNIYINPDLTFIQREKNRKLRNELKEKREQGLDVFIKNGKVMLRRDAVSTSRGRNFH